MEYSSTITTFPIHENRRLAILQAAATIAAGANTSMSASTAVDAAFKIYDEAVRQDEARLETADADEASEGANDFRESLDSEHGFTKQ